MARLVGKRRRTLKRKSSWFFWACISILIGGTEKVEETATCAASIPAISGSQSVVHCYFPTPLKANDSFGVELHQIIPGSGPRLSLPYDCYYGERGVQCTKGEGYEASLENNPSLTVKLNIRNVSQSHSGRYVCKKTPGPLGNHKGCMLNVKERNLSNRSTSCSTTGQVEGQPSAVTCHLTEDPSRNQHYFKVLRYDFDKTDSLPKIILACEWSSGSTKPECEAAEGYFFDYKVEKLINVVIINTNKSHEGRYFCDDALSFPDNIGFCDLKVKDMPGPEPGNTWDNKNETWNIVMTVLFVTVVGSLLIIGYVFMTCKKKTSCLSRGDQQPSNPDTNELSSSTTPMIQGTNA